MLLAGSSSGEWAEDNAGGSFDFAAILLDTTALPSAVPTPVPTVAGNTATLPSLAPTPSFGTTQPPVQPSAANPTFTPNPDTPLSMPTSAPIPTTGENGGNTTMIYVIVGVSLLIGVVVTLGLLWLRRHRKLRHDGVDAVTQSIVPRRHVVPSTTRDTPPDEDVPASSDVQTRADVNEYIAPTSFDTIVEVSDIVEGNAALLQLNGESGQAEGESEVDSGHDGHQPSVSPVANRHAQLSAIQDEADGYDVPWSVGSANVSMDGIREPVHGVGVVRAVIEAAEGLARVSQFPGVSDVVGSVIVLVHMVTARSDLLRVADNMVKRCRTLVLLLQRASSVLGKV